jgi:hypothetical protein
VSDRLAAGALCCVQCAVCGASEAARVGRSKMQQPSQPHASFTEAARLAAYLSVC